jgi:type IV fimbrial biogenesis protein FimT
MRMRRRTLGFTLIEMMVTVSVATILTVVAVPNMQSMMLRRQLEGAAGEIYSNLLLMRSQAIEKNRTVYVNFSGSGTTWTYGLDDVASCSPATANDCQINQGTRVYSGSTWRNVTLSHPFAGNTLTFESRRGLPSASGTIRLTSTAGEIQVSVSPIGYVSVCSAQRLGGYSAC